MNKVLLKNENILHKAAINNGIFISSLSIFFIGLISLVVFYNFNLLIFILISSLITILSMYFIFDSLLYNFTTKITFTNERLIINSGFFNKKLIELDYQKIESFRIEQSIIDRVFNSGTIIIHGIGGIIIPIPSVDKPFELREKYLYVTNK